MVVVVVVVREVVADSAGSLSPNVSDSDNPSTSHGWPLDWDTTI